METMKVKNKQFIRLVFKLLFTKNVLVELLEKTPRDKKRKVCSQCHNQKHGWLCKVKENNMYKVKEDRNKFNDYILSREYIDRNNKRKKIIRDYILSQELTKDNDEIFQELSDKLNISLDLCKTLYFEIPSKEFEEDSLITLIIKSFRRCFKGKE